MQLNFKNPLAGFFLPKNNKNQTTLAFEVVTIKIHPIKILMNNKLYD
jgi:hypothetical protein